MDEVRIGLKDVYDTVTGLDKKFDAFAAEHDKKLALLDQRVTRVEKNADQQWKVKLALASAVVSPVVSAVVAVVTVKQGA